MIDFRKHHLRGLILDMDGVLWKDSESIGSLPIVFDRIQSLQLKVTLATNNATKTVDQYLEKLQSFNVTLQPEQIITSSMATAAYLTEHIPSGSEVYVIGMDGLRNTITEAGFILSESNPAAVIVSVDRFISYEKIATAMRLIRSGIPFLATNPDVTFPTPKGLFPGAGAIIAAVATAAECDPIYMGKPALPMIEMALHRMQLSPAEVLVVGDRLETDILAGQNAGCKTALVLSGVTRMEQVNHNLTHPDFIEQNLSEILGC